MVDDPETPLRRLVIAVDVHRYSERDTLAQVDVQATLIDALDKAAAQSGLDRSTWSTQPQGDAEVAVLPPDVPEATVVADFVRELEYRLSRVNRTLKREARLRLRVAMHSGIVHFGRNGFPGPAVVEACRLLNAPQLKDAIREFDDADVALIVSERLFRDIVRPGYRGLRSGDFRKVSVSVKEFTGFGYLNLRGLASSGAGSECAVKDEDQEQGTSRDRKLAPTYQIEGHNIAIGGGDAVGRDKITKCGDSRER